MRARSILLIVAILLVAGFAALNWSEVVRPAPLLFGPVVADAPMGAILLGLLALAVVIFALWSASTHAYARREAHNHHRELEAQRALAEKAEASRFTELRQHFDTHLRDMRERDGIVATEMEKSRLESQREIRTQLEQINRTLSARLNELEHRLENRLERMGTGRGPATTSAPAMPLVQDTGAPGPEHAQVQRRLHEAEVHDAQAREVHDRREPVLGDNRDLRSPRESHDADLRAERETREEERATTADRPAQTGWRRWF